ncbi:MAG: ArnT family glycosyltransferase [Armatimonadota bacterium]
MENLSAVCLSGLVILAGTGLGHIIRAFHIRQEESPDERFIYDTAIGIGFFSLLMFLLSALQLLDSRWIPGAVCVLGVFGLGVALPSALSGTRRIIKRRRTRWQTVCGGLLILLFATVLVPAMAPPAMSDWDSLAYHLAVPKLWIKHGGFYYIDFVSHSNFPFLTEMLYIPGIMLDNPGAAKLVHFWIGVLLVGTVVITARRHISRGCAWPSALAIAGMPIVMWEATTAYIDLATAFYTLTAICLLLNYFDTSDQHYLTTSAICAGFCASTKMTGLQLIPILLIWLLVDRRIFEGRFVWKNAIKFAVVGVLVCSAWHVKTFIHTGNPVYPFFYNIFGGRNWNAELAKNYAMLQGRFGIGHDISSLLTLPYDLTFRSDAFYDTPGLYVGPLIIASVPLLLFARSGSRKLTGMLCAFLVQVLIWFVLTQQSRYLIPAFAVLAPLASGLLWRDVRLQKVRPVWWAMVFLTALFGLWTLVPAARQAIPYVMGLESRDDYLTKSLDIYPAVQFINEELPTDARVALFGDTRGFYIDRAYVWADYGHNLKFSRHYRSIEEFVQALKNDGITHALINFRFFPDEHEAKHTAKLVYEAIHQGVFEPVYPESEDGRGVMIFRVR